MVRFAPFFFFFFLNFGPNRAVSADTVRFGRYRPILADTGRYRPIPADIGRYGPSRPDLGRIGADFGRVGPIWESPRGTTWHGHAICGVPPASPRPAVSDAGALAWEPHPCIPVCTSLLICKPSATLHLTAYEHV